MMSSTLVLIQCDDRKGLVALISRILASHNLNIAALREFVDPSASLFFARFLCQGAAQPDDGLRAQLLKELPDGAQVQVNPPMPKRLGVMVSKEYHCLGDIMTRHFFESEHYRVCCVVGNHEDLREYTERFGVPFHWVTHEGKSKQAFEEEMLTHLAAYAPDYLVLAKFMRILTPDFVRQYPQRIINIHHSFLPAFAGSRPYRQAFERGVKLIGATAHFVSDELDAGPIITQSTIEVDHNYTVLQMVEAGKEVEKAVLNKAIQLVCNDQVFVSNNKTIVFK